MQVISLFRNPAPISTLVNEEQWNYFSRPLGNGNQEGFSFQIRLSLCLFL